ncbi:MAG: DUF6804 family protein [Candidatus Daviesbacteria bacterium]
MSIKKVCLISGFLLLLAIPTGLPSAYYQLLRFIIFAVAAFVAWKFYESKLPAWTYVFGAVAFLFNPIFPIYLDKSAWVVIDFVSAILFFLAGHSVKRNKN